MRTYLRLHEATEQGDISAQYNLGVIYDNGDDYIEAFKWFSITMGLFEGLSATVGESDLKELTSKMTAAQISEAMRRTTEWVKSHGGCVKKLPLKLL